MSNEKENDSEKGRKDTKKRKDFRVWKQNQNLKGDDIIYKSSFNQNKIKHLSLELNEEEIYQNRKKTNMGDKEDEIKTNNNLESHISENVQRVISDVSKVLKTINESHEEIKKLNAIYLMQTSQKINKEKNKDDNILPPIRERSLTEGNIKREPPINWKLTNDTYRKQLNRAFLNFNPLIHLGNLNMLRKADPEINEDIEKLAKHIDEDLNKITDKYYYKHRYEEIVNKRKQDESKMEYNNKKNCINKNEKNLGMNDSETNKNTGVNIFREAKKQLEKLSNNISNDNIEHFCSQYKKVEIMEKKKQLRQFFPGIISLKEFIKGIRHEKMVKPLIERNMMKKKALREENENLIKHIENIKKNLIHEIEVEEERKINYLK